MNIIAFGASNSKRSINKQFATYIAGQFYSQNTEILDLNDFPLPLYSIDTENETRIPENAKKFYSKLNTADFIIVSLAEHNGTYTTAFKNLFDWVSRYELKMFSKKMFLVSTSTGKRGGLNVMEAALVRFPLHGAEILGHFCLPFFEKNFDAEKGILDSDIKTQFEAVLSEVKNKL
jgi:NAD(P)H-dependent FMN reductase